MCSLVPGKKITMEGEKVISQALGSGLWIVGVEQGEAECTADSHRDGRSWWAVIRSVESFWTPSTLIWPRILVRPEMPCEVICPLVDALANVADVVGGGTEGGGGDRGGGWRRRL